MEIVFNMPLYVVLVRKKYYINLNGYRNWHYHLNNVLKQLYSDLVFQQVLENNMQKIDYKVNIDFLLIRGDKRCVDKANVLSIHEKFFCDALVCIGIIEDDNDTIFNRHTYHPTIYRKGSSKVKIVLTRAENT